MPCPVSWKLIEGMGRHPEGKVMKVMEIRKRVISSPSSFPASVVQFAAPDLAHATGYEITPRNRFSA
ncbi:hypothetical protein [Microseira wollei]|uniref:hypothetical protein n=1 Tax=Microseira wollei TaxID=467598 RepID=UPI001CFED48D|nr:hypothetical protein [Microseira wollei]